MDKGIRLIFTLLFSVVVFLFLVIFYRGHLMMMEFGGLFLFSWDYFIETFSVPGGLTHYLVAFIIQLFHIPALGALMVTLLLLDVSLLLYKMSRARTSISFALSFLPAIVLFSVLCLNVSAQAALLPAVAIVLSLALAVPTRNSKAWVCAITVPFIYYLAGPLSIVYPLVLLPTRKKAALPALVVYIVCALLTYFLYIPNPLYVLFDLNISGDTFVMAMLVQRVLPVAVTVLVAFLPAFNENAHFAIKIAFSAIVLALLTVSCFAHYNGEVERVCRYDSLLQKADWRGILKMASKKSPYLYEEVFCTDLALAMTGRLEDEMFAYPQGGPSSFVTPFSTSISPLYAAELYVYLGMLPTAQRFVFEAQVSGFVGEANARCHKLLARINAGLGFSAVAQKYADELSHTLFYRGWAKKFNPDKREKCLSDALDGNLYYIDGNFGDVVSECLKSADDAELKFRAELARTYMLCWYLLSNDLDGFAANFDYTIYKTIPRVYQEAYVLYWAQHHDDFSRLPSCFSEKITSGLLEFAAARGQHKGQDYLRRHYGKTYWYYAFYSRPQ